MKLFYPFSVLLFCFAISVNGQSIKIRQDNQSSSPEELDLATYDGKTPTFDLQILKKYPNYYNGHKVLFLPAVEHVFVAHEQLTEHTLGVVPGVLDGEEKLK